MTRKRAAAVVLWCLLLGPSYIALTDKARIASQREYTDGLPLALNMDTSVVKHQGRS